MTSTATQKGRHAELTTPLGADVLLITGLDAEESLSQLFEFSIDTVASREKSIAFDQLIGQGVTVKLIYPGTSKERFFHGLCRSVTQGDSDETWTRYRLGLVPAAWVLTRRTQSRIFQHINVPDILKKVLTGLDVAYELQGTYEPRDYCVQYRESDFHFAARLMEEEGIYYFFKHSNGAHKMVVADTPQSHSDVPYDPDVVFKHPTQAGASEEDVIYSWTKTQQLTSGKVTLWDHCFELPHKHLEASKEIQESVMMGTADHKLKVGDNGKLELYDFPGAYAQRFDGIDKGGGDNAGDLQKIFQDNARTTSIRMQAEGTRSVAVSGASMCRQLTAGHKFNVKNVPDDKLAAALKAVGQYVLTSVSHHATLQGDFRTGGGGEFRYRNSFQAIPAALPYRPQRLLERPTVAGSQTAVVVGPKGEEIFTDKYGRVKVQFHWDRQGKNDADSSCWLRVGTPWAGRGWGLLHIPRIGQEVIVDFLEGDPDQPIIVGSVYNADQMPAYTLPDERTKSYLKSNTSPGGAGHNEIRLEDKKGVEQIFIHGERNQDIRIKNDCMENIMHDRHLTVGVEKDGKKIGNQTEEVKVDKFLTIHRDHHEHIGRTMNLHIGGIDGGKGDLNIQVDNDKKEIIKGNFDLNIVKNLLVKIGGSIALWFKGDIISKIEGKQNTEVKKERAVKIGGANSLAVGGDSNTKIGGNQSLDIVADNKTKIGGDLSMKVAGKTQFKTGSAYGHEAGQEIHLKAGMKVIIEAGAQLSLKGPGGFIDIGPTGVTIQGTMVLINSGGAAGSGSGSSPVDPDKPAGVTEPSEAQPPAEFTPKKPNPADDSASGKKSCN